LVRAARLLKGILALEKLKNDLWERRGWRDRRTVRRANS
jgi:hypothetical protein